MNLLIINTLPEAEPAAQQAICALAEKVDEYRVIHTAAMRIAPCVGCNSCWLKTPGVCALKDDYEQILKAYLEYDAAIFISGTSLGFIDHKTKNLIDRSIPLGTMYTHIVNGQMRHVPRYDKVFHFGLIYTGEADREYLELWLKRFALNFNSVSIGAFPVEKIQEVSLCT